MRFRKLSLMGAHFFCIKVGGFLNFIQNKGV